MSHSARFMVAILIIAIIFIFTFSGYCSDSLKDGLAFQNFASGQTDSLLQETTARFRIIFAPTILSKSDSSSLLFQRSLFDSLKKISILPQFSKIEFEFLAIDSINQKELIDDSLQNLGKSQQAHLILSGKIDSDKQQHPIYFPRLLVLKQNNYQNPFDTDYRLFAGKICYIKQFDLPAVSLKNIFNLADFIKGYFLIQDRKYSDSIEQLKNLNSFPAYFHLAESYLYQGAALENDTMLKKVNCDSSIFYWKKCLLETASHLDSVYTYNNLGLAFQLGVQLDSAVLYFSKANSYWSETAKNNDFIQISHNLSTAYLLSGQREKALDIFQSTVTAMEQSNDSLNLAYTYETMGHIYQLISQRESAILYYQRALTLREKINDRAGIANTYGFLGNAYQANKNYQLATRYFKQSVAQNLEIHYESQLARAYNNLGLAFQDTGQLDSALFYFKKGNETFNLLDDKEGSLQTMFHQASIYQKQNVLDEAISLYEKALEMKGENNSESLRAQVYDRLGDIYNHQDNLVPALDYYQQAANLYEKAGNFETLSLILYNMGLIKLKQNAFAEGYQLLKKAIAFDEAHGFNNLSSEQNILYQVEGILKKN